MESKKTKYMNKQNGKRVIDREPAGGCQRGGGWPEERNS